MPQQPPAFDPKEFAPAFDPNEFSQPAAKAPDTSWFDTAAGYVPEPVKSAWNWMWEPKSDLPSRAANVVAEPLMSFGESGNEWYRKPALYGGAFAQSVGDVLSGLTSPGNIGTAVATGGVGTAAKYGLPKIAQSLATGAKIGGGLTAAHGGLQMVNPESTTLERGLGALEAIGGGLAARTKIPSVPTRTAGEIELPPIKSSAAPIVEDLPLKSADPNFNAGMGDPELAGSIPYQAAPESIPAAAAEVFDPSTLKGMEPAVPPKTELEVLDPSTGEIRPASQAKPGDIPLPSNEPAAPRIPGREKMILSEGESLAEANEMKARTPKQYIEGKPQVDTGPIVKENVATPEEAVQALSQRLEKAVRDAGKPNPKAATDVKELLENAEEVIKTASEQEKPGLIRQILGANKALLTSWDLSAPGRQGKALMLNKAWWTSLDDMVKAWGSKGAAEAINQSIIDHPSGYFKRATVNGKPVKSFAEKAGLDLASTEEMFTGKLGANFEKYSGVGKSSRAHTAFLNKLRSDQFVSMMDDAKRAGFDPEKNMNIAQAYAKFINDATGRGSLNFGKWKLERNIAALNDVFFAPKNMSGQIRTWNNVLNPMKYYNYDPVLRKQALRSLFAVAGMGLGVGEIARMVGAKVSNDPTSSDFRKIKVGDTRIDPFGGYQQFPVAAMKLILGQSTSTVSGKTTDLTGDRYGQQTRQSVAERYFTNRLSPLGSFVYAWMNNREFDGKPFEAKRALYERVFPIAMKDLTELFAEDPALGAMFAAPSIMGMVGTQTYSGR